jgi:hypothetical protein
MQLRIDVDFALLFLYRVEVDRVAGGTKVRAASNCREEENSIRITLQVTVS